MKNKVHPETAQAIANLIASINVSNLMREGSSGNNSTYWLAQEFKDIIRLTEEYLHGFEQAESLLAENKADVVGFARQALADPDWFEKVRLGHGGEVLLCRYSNYCEGLDQKHKQVTCELWDRKALDAPEAVLASDGKRRLTAPQWRPKNP